MVEFKIGKKRRGFVCERIEGGRFVFKNIGDFEKIGVCLGDCLDYYRGLERAEDDCG